MSVFLYIFAAYTPDHRCLVPVCDNSSLDLDLNLDHDQQGFRPNWTQFAIPKSAIGGGGEEEGLLAMTSDMEQCRRYEAIDGSGACESNNFNQAKMSGCDGQFIYDQSVFGRTVTTELNLVCNLKERRKFLGTLMMFGLLTGSFLGGWASDYFGRKSSMFTALLILAPCMTATGFATSYEMYASLHLVCCTMVPILWLTKHTLCLEIFSSSHKKAVLCAKVLMWTSSLLLLVVMVYFFRDWTSQHLITGCLAAASLLLWPLIPESPRWLAQNGKVDQARRLLLSIADSNGKHIVSKDEDVIRNFLDGVEAATKERRESTSVLNLFGRHFLLTTVILIASWIMANTGFYTLSLNASKLHGDLFINYALTFGIQVFQAPFLWFSIDWWGRKIILSATQLVVGICCLILAFIPKDMTIIILVFFLLGNLSCNMSFALCWFLTPDFYPTNLRSQATGLSSTFARAVGLVVPYIAGLSHYWKPLPMLLLGLPFLIISVCIMLFIPEVTHCQMPQNTEEAKKLHGTRKTGVKP